MGDPMAATGFVPRGLHGQLVHELGIRIAHGEMVPGEQIVPVDVGDRYGVSRTVVREALRVLESKGMVAARPRTGTRVLPPDDWNVLDPDVIRWRVGGPDWRVQLTELLDLRAGVEPLAARACARVASPSDVDRLSAHCDAMDRAVLGQNLAAFHDADLAFHRDLLRASGNQVLRRLSGAIDAVLEARESLSLQPGHLSAAAADAHSRIVEAIRVADPAGAEAASRALIDTAADEIHGVLADGRHEPVPP